jgi:hypothetical protein
MCLFNSVAVVDFTVAREGFGYNRSQRARGFSGILRAIIICSSVLR